VSKKTIAAIWPQKTRLQKNKSSFLRKEINVSLDPCFEFVHAHVQLFTYFRCSWNNSFYSKKYSKITNKQTNKRFVFLLTLDGNLGNPRNNKQNKGIKWE
jgi:hypothetical protein